MSKTKNAFVIIHFGSNEKYFELELYFCMMLQKYTRNNIIYMYSETDTPSSFVSAISPFVYRTQGFNDNGITYNVTFESKYSSFNTLRTCDFIFAYKLTEYEKICIVESDLVIMGNIDSIFNLNSPSILCYRCGDRNLNKNFRQTSSKDIVLSQCIDGSGLNGGVMLITPSEELFNQYVSAIPLISKQGCKYPNEALFEYINNIFYNLPVIYNLSHYHTLKL
jgi:alpha-N-acetylglucosamine transferase